RPRCSSRYRRRSPPLRLGRTARPCRRSSGGAAARPRADADPAGTRCGHRTGHRSARTQRQTRPHRLHGAGRARTRRTPRQPGPRPNSPGDDAADDRGSGARHSGAAAAECPARRCRSHARRPRARPHRLPSASPPTPAQIAADRRTGSRRGCLGLHRCLGLRRRRACRAGGSAAIPPSRRPHRGSRCRRRRRRSDRRLTGPGRRSSGREARPAGTGEEGSGDTGLGEHRRRRSGSLRHRSHRLLSHRHRARTPSIEPAAWSLRIHGRVDNEGTLTRDDVLDLRLEERHITLTCVSNPVGGDLGGTATWLGYPIRALLGRARPRREADMVLSHSFDGFTASTPLPALTDDRDALLAVGMNGGPLPPEHGFPARLVVPGLYGFVSATKWVTELEVTRFDEKTAYWTDRGWDAAAPILVASRIEVPKPLATVSAGDLRAGGTAWAQRSGIERVEVRLDDGDWTEATLAEEVTIDTWRQWRADFSEVEPGSHTLTVRATDRDGNVQTAKRRDSIPNSATGHHHIQFRAE